MFAGGLLTTCLQVMHLQVLFVGCASTCCTSGRALTGAVCRSCIDRCYVCRSCCSTEENNGPAQEDRPSDVGKHTGVGGDVP